MSENIICEVRNRDSGSVGYSIPDLGIHRSFAPGETKKIPLGELKQLQFVSGGNFILKELLIVNNKNALEILNMEVEPEYFYTEEDIRKILTKGTLEQLLDVLDFAPEGAIELIKKISVEIELPDMQKREAISVKTGFNINNAINVNKIMNSENEEKNEEDTKKKQRRTAPMKNTELNKKTEAPKYNVVKKK